MDDTGNGGPRPIGRRGDLISRLELDARIDATNKRVANVAARSEQNRSASEERDEQLDREFRKLALLMGQRIRALEARTVSGRIRQLRAWFDRVTASVDAAVMATAIALDHDGVEPAPPPSGPKLLP